MLQNKIHDRDPVWHVQAIMLVVIGLQLALPDRYVFGVRWLIPALELLLVGLLMRTTPKQAVFRSSKRRLNVLLLLAVVVLGNLYALYHVANQLLAGGRLHDGRALILTAINIYLTNLVIFGLLYWEMDGGGPGERRAAESLARRDFLFPQSQVAVLAKWHPTFIDYLYVSSTNATAFSPTDTLPLSRRAKLLMLFQALISLVVVALVAARAVNILS